MSSSEERLPLTLAACDLDGSYRAADRNSGINYPFEPDQSTTETKTSESGRAFSSSSGYMKHFGDVMSSRNGKLKLRNDE